MTDTATATAPLVWNTKYGRRKVRQERPTLQEAIAAAQGMTDDTEAQVEFAASLMDLPVDEVREAIQKARRSTIRLAQVNSISRNDGRAVVVERTVSRRVAGVRKFNV